MISRSLLYIAVVIATAALVVGYALRGFWIGSAVMLAMGLLWILGVRLRWAWISSLLFMVYATLNAFVFLILAPSYLEIISITATLIAWDLAFFIGRLEKARTPELAHALEISHLRRLLVIAGSGLLLMGAAIFVHIQLSFAVSFLMGGIALLALVQVVSRLGHRVEKPRPGQVK